MRCTTTSGPIWGTLPRPRTLPSSSLNAVPNKTLINTNRHRQTNSNCSSSNRWAAVNGSYWGSGGSSRLENGDFYWVPRERCSLFVMYKQFPTFPAGSGLRVTYPLLARCVLLSLTLLLGTSCVTSLDQPLSVSLEAKSVNAHQGCSNYVSDPIKCRCDCSGFIF